jgi:hypothetical protein
MLLSEALRSIGLLCALKGKDADRCHAHLNIFYNFNWSLGSLIAEFQSNLALAFWLIRLLCAPKSQNADRCHAHLNIFYNFNWSLGSRITINLILLSEAA